MDLSHSGAVEAPPEEGLCLPGSGAFSSLLVPTAHGISRGSEFSGSIPGGHQEVLQSPSQLPGLSWSADPTALWMRARLCP